MFSLIAIAAATLSPALPHRTIRVDGVETTYRTEVRDGGVRRYSGVNAEGKAFAFEVDAKGWVRGTVGERAVEFHARER